VQAGRQAIEALIGRKAIDITVKAISRYFLSVKFLLISTSAPLAT
jgi:hypothetical protein